MQVKFSLEKKTFLPASKANHVSPYAFTKAASISFCHLTSSTSFPFSFPLLLFTGHLVSYIFSSPSQPGKADSPKPQIFNLNPHLEHTKN